MRKAGTSQNCRGKSCLQALLAAGGGCQSPRREVRVEGRKGVLPEPGLGKKAVQVNVH